MLALLNRSKTRPAHVTVAERLRAAGHDPASLNGRDLGPATAAAATHTACDGTLISGVMYQLDYVSEEEHGIGKVRVAISGTDPRKVTMTGDARRHVARFADVNAIVLSSQALPTRTYAWGDNLDTGARTNGWSGEPWPADHQPPYALSYSQRVPYARRDEYARAVENGRVSMAALREKAKSLGLTDLPRRKVDLARTLLNSPQYLATVELSDVWPAWFATGRQLVLRADADATGVALEALGDAIDAGTLAVGTYSGAFASGFFLYDARDETDAIRADRVARADWYDARMADLEPVADALTAAGHRWYFLGRPTELNTGDGRTVVRYWLNSQGRHTAKDGTTCYKQVSGWYTLAELAAEKFVHDGARKEVADASRRR